MVIYHKMENALARAEELLAVGQQSAGLQVLYDAIMSRHFQHNLLALEPIVNKFVELCVVLRQGKLVKDGLMQYRSFSQNTNMNAFENILRRFIKISEDKLSEALNEAVSATVLEVETDPAVEEINRMLQAQLHLETGKDRVDRQTVMPWMRFMWEAYRVVIELCRNNAKVEKLYSELVIRSFDYCVKNQRKGELKRLTETLRHHLGTIVKNTHNQQNGINLIGENANPESQQLQLDIRYRQLDVALEMELWQEAFRSIEDIHGLFLLGGKSAESLIGREEYFEKVARIFSMSDNTLFYAAALLRRFHAMDSASSEKGTVGLNAVISALAIPLGSVLVNESVFSSGSWSFLEDQHSRVTRLAYFLGLDCPPTQQSIIHQLLELSICTDECLTQLLVLIDSGTLNCDLEAITKYGKQLSECIIDHPELHRFLPAIHVNMIFMHLKYLESRNESFNLPSTQASLKSALFMKTLNLELLLFKWTKSGDFAFSFDQSTGMIEWTPAASLLSDPSPVFFDYDEPRTVYLHQLCEMLSERSESAVALTKALYDKLEAAKRESIRRQEAAEKLREEREVQRREREKEEAKERAARLSAELEAEERRLTEESSAREKARVAKERENIRKEEQKKKEEEEKRLVELSGVRANMERLQQLAVRFDHMERALRHEELSILEADYNKQLESDIEAYKRRVKSVNDNSLKQYTFEREMRAKLTGITQQVDSFMLKVKAGRALKQSKDQEALNVRLGFAKQDLIDSKKKEAEEIRSRKSVSLADAISATLTEKKSAAEVYVPPYMKSQSPLAQNSGSSGKPDSSQSSQAGWRRPESKLEAPQEQSPQKPLDKPQPGKYVPPHRK